MKHWRKALPKQLWPFKSTESLRAYVELGRG